MKFTVLLIFAISLCPSTDAQGDGEPQFPEPGTYIENVVNGWHVRFESIPVDLWYEEIRAYTDTTERTYLTSTEIFRTEGRRTVSDPEEINRLLPGGAHVVMSRSVYSETETLDRFVTAGGMNVVPDIDALFMPVYFPDDGIMGFHSYFDTDKKEIMMPVDIVTGEDAFFDRDIMPLGGSLRVVRKYYQYRWYENVFVQYLDESTGVYRDIGPVQDLALYGERQYLGLTTFYSTGSDILYTTGEYEGYYRVTLEPASGPQPDKPAISIKRPVFPPPYETEVRDPLEIDYGMTDRILDVQGYRVRYRRIPRVDFERLREYYGPHQVWTGWGITGLDSIRAYLPEYDIRSYGYKDLIYDIRRGNEMRIFLPGDCYPGYTYYPDEEMLTFMGPADTEEGINIRTGKREGHIPTSTYYSPGKDYRIAGVYNSQDSYNYRFERRNESGDGYIHMFYLWNIIFDEGISFFWIGNTCYFIDPYGDGYGMSYCSVTLPPP
ncbi:MAG: hypothetical protein LIO85_07045 [Rikenellaceae bacterium]|nr:hypothetical protein [Rikenellaceae bacterium]